MANGKSQTLSRGPQVAHWGIAAMCAFSAIACGVSAFRSETPRLETLSQHSITPVDFDLIHTVRSRVPQARPTVVGYAFVIPKGSIPAKYDKGTEPAVSEPPIQDPKWQYLFIHSSITLDEPRISALHQLVGTPINAWFHQGKIIALADSKQTWLDIRESDAGFRSNQKKWWCYAVVALFAAIAALFWPRIHTRMKRIMATRALAL